MPIEELVQQYSDDLYRVAYVYVKDLQLAEDIVQDVFLTYYIKDAFLGRASVKTYLTKMTIHRCYDYLRRQKVRKFFQLETFWRSERAAEAVVVSQMEQDDILQQVLALPLKYREVVLYFYYQDLTVTEIAALLKLPASTVSTRLQRARERLKQVLPKLEWEVLGNG